MFDDLMVVLPVHCLNFYLRIFVPAQHLCVAMFVRKLQLQEELKGSVYVMSV